MIAEFACADRRPTCAVCRRPAALCYCAHVSPQRTRTEVVVLQHPREARVPLGTLRMVQLSLPEATVRRGVDFSKDLLVRDLCLRQPPPYVLYPGPGAWDLEELAGQSITLIAVDGTWSQAGQLLRKNPVLAALPRVALPPGAPRAYRIRRQPAEHCVSTLEALARALDVLEGPPGHFQELLLRPLRALVEGQLRYSQEHKAYRVRRPRHRTPKPPPPDSAARLHSNWERLVCAQGEANDWPASQLQRPEPEIVQWQACRVATGETFTATVRPRKPLGPCTDYAELPAEVLLAGSGWDAFVEEWRGFVRPDDVLAVWGHFHATLAAKEGLPLPETRIDVRAATSRHFRRRLGTIARCAELLEAQVQAPAETGRCARRLTLLEAVARRLRECSGLA
jgi:DTW domain-containing protein YfiP